MKSRRLSRTLACASLLSLALSATPAAAKQIDRIVVFGDSYADTGNALRLAGINPITTQVYTTGRFSGGSNLLNADNTRLNEQPERPKPIRTPAPRSSDNGVVE